MGGVMVGDEAQGGRDRRAWGPLDGMCGPGGARGTESGTTRSMRGGGRQDGGEEGGSGGSGTREGAGSAGLFGADRRFGWRGVKGQGCAPGVGRHHGAAGKRGRWDQEGHPRPQCWAGGSRGSGKGRQKDRRKS